MIRRLAYIETDKTLGDSGEYTTDINIADPITSIMVLFHAVNGATDNVKNTVYDCVSALEIIDGSEVLYSLDMKEALALAAYRLGHMPYQVVGEIGGWPQEAHVPILFGRYKGDPVYAFDPKRFANPQFRIKWNLATLNAVAATAFATGSARLTLIADIMEGAASPSSMLVAKQHYSWTTSSGGVEYIDLPTDHPYHSLLLRAEKAASYVDGIVSNLKLSCEGGKVVPMDIQMLDWLWEMAERGYRFDMRHGFHTASGTTIYVLLKYEEEVQLISEGTPNKVLSYANQGYGEGLVTVYSADAPDSGQRNIGAHVHGMCPFRCVYVPFGLNEDPATWFPATMFKSIRLEATGATASGSGYLVITQERPY